MYCGTFQCHLPPVGWGVCRDAVPSVVRSRVHRSGRTTSLSSCSVVLCTGHRVGWTGCGSTAAAGSTPPHTDALGWAGPGSAGLWSGRKNGHMTRVSVETLTAVIIINIINYNNYYCSLLIQSCNTRGCQTCGPWTTTGLTLTQNRTQTFSTASRSFYRDWK